TASSSRSNASAGSVVLSDDGVLSSIVPGPSRRTSCVPPYALFIPGVGKRIRSVRGPAARLHILQIAGQNGLPVHARHHRCDASTPRPSAFFAAAVPGGIIGAGRSTGPVARLQGQDA